MLKLAARSAERLDESPRGDDATAACPAGEPAGRARRPVVGPACRTGNTRATGSN